MVPFLVVLALPVVLWQATAAPGLRRTVAAGTYTLTLIQGGHRTTMRVVVG